MTSHTPPDNGNHNSGNAEHEHHITPMGVYVKVFSCLIGLTILTVVTSLFDFGVMNIVVAMIIAVIKALLVVFFFMQLKFDDIGNKVTFASAFAFLAIFIGLTSSDLFFRHKVEPMNIDASGNQGETDQNKLRIATPDLIKKGKETFQVQCASCHGDGHGDGLAAAALNPKPRNFFSGYWKFGGSPTRVFHTITVGSPGTGMASFSNLSIETRYALAHYVRSLSPNHPDDTPADLKAAGIGADGKAAAVAEVQPIPIDMAMEKMEVPDQVIMPAGELKNPHHPGAKIFLTQCAGCHGVNAVGAHVSPIGVNPNYDLMTAAWAGSHAGWTSSEGDFTKIVTEGFPGRGMPSMNNFTKEELTQLYAYVKELVH